MHTEIYCETLENLDKVKAIRAIHQALLQLVAIENTSTSSGNDYDNMPAILALRELMADAGHIAFVK